MISRVDVATGCRIHFGLAELCQSSSNCFAGLGLALDEPGFDLSLVPIANTKEIAGGFAASDLAEYHDRASEVLRRCGLDGDWQVYFRSVLPLHHGLGAGTQLAMAVAAACQAILNSGQSSTEELVARSGRGKRSAIGLTAFTGGGFIVDRGYDVRSRGPREIACQSYVLPPEWRIILATPQVDAGLSGQPEHDVIAGLGERPNPEYLRMVELMGMLEANLASCETVNFEEFTAVLSEYMRLAAQLFVSAQGGLYNGQQLSQTASALSQAGASAVGQSSWGPTIFGFSENPESADEIVSRFNEKPSTQCDVRIIRPARSGAQITIA